MNEEVITLSKNVSTAKARGQVDRWLADLDKQMKESLQKPPHDVVSVSCTQLHFD